MADQTVSCVVVAAPAAAIMRVIADLNAYPDWNDEVKSVEVLSRHGGADGRPAQVRFVLDAGAVKDSYTLAYEWVGDAVVQWSLVGEAQMLRRLDGAYELLDRGDGSTEVTYRLTADTKVPMIGLMKRKIEKVIVDRALKGLKKRVES